MIIHIIVLILLYLMLFFLLFDIPGVEKETEKETTNKVKLSTMEVAKFPEFRDEAKNFHLDSYGENPFKGQSQPTPDNIETRAKKFRSHGINVMYGDEPKARRSV